MWHVLYNVLHCPVGPAVYKTSTTSIKSVGFTITGIPFNFWFCSLVTWNFKSHKNGMGFFGGYILVRGFFGVLLEALVIFLGLDFWLHSITLVTWNPDYPPWGCEAPWSNG